MLVKILKSSITTAIKLLNLKVFSHKHDKQKWMIKFVIFANEYKLRSPSQRNLNLLMYSETFWTFSVSVLFRFFDRCYFFFLCFFLFYYLKASKQVTPCFDVNFRFFQRKKIYTLVYIFLLSEIHRWDCQLKVKLFFPGRRKASGVNRIVNRTSTWDH